MQYYVDCGRCGQTHTWHSYEEPIERCLRCGTMLPIEPVWRGERPFCPFHGEPAVLGESGLYWCECESQEEAGPRAAWIEIMEARDSMSCNHGLLSDERYLAFDERVDIDAFLSYCAGVPVADSIDRLPTMPVPERLRRLLAAANEAYDAGAARWRKAKEESAE